jgi:hypothetical protein
MMTNFPFFLKSILLLLFLARPETAAQRNIRVDFEVRLHPISFDSMLVRESSKELSYFDTEKEQRRKVWRVITRRYFRSGRSCRGKVKPCTMPFILCESTPRTTIIKRRQKLVSKLLHNTPPTQKDNVKIENLHFYNDAERTCFFASMPPKIATRMAIKSCKSELNKCLIHSLSPMLKPLFETVDIVTKNSENNAHHILFAELSPYHKKKGLGISIEKLVEDVLGSGDQYCEMELEDTFPSTSLSLNCQHSLTSSQIQIFLEDDSKVIQIQISPVVEELPAVSRERVLRFIAGLAVRPEFISIEVLDSYYYYYGYLHR